LPTGTTRGNFSKIFDIFLTNHRIHSAKHIKEDTMTDWEKSYAIKFPETFELRRDVLDARLAISVILSVKPSNILCVLQGEYILDLGKPKM
jgi:hypothetical protein